MEHMTPRNAIKRLGWRFSEASKTPNKAIRINQEDVTALESIATFYEDVTKQLIGGNQLFGKLYIYLFTEFVKHYNCTVMDDIPQKELHKILDKDLRLIVTEAQESLNLCELESAIKNGRHKEYSPMEYNEIADNFKSMISAAIITYGKN